MVHKTHKIMELYWNLAMLMALKEKARGLVLLILNMGNADNRLYIERTSYLIRHKDATFQMLCPIQVYKVNL